MAVCVALLVAAWCLRDDFQPDVYFHLAAGRWILESGLPDRNVFLAFHGDHPFVDHEWLFQAGAWLGWRLGGAPLLTLAKTAAVGLALALVARAGRGLGAAGLVVLVPAVLVAGQRFVLRPEVVTYLGVALHLFVLLRARGRPGRGAIAGLGAFQALWASCHGYALLGPVMSGGALAGAGLGRLLGRPRQGAPADLRALGLLVGVELVASVLNPYGLEAALYPLHLLRTGGTGDLAIVELTSPFAPELAGRVDVRVYLGMAAATAALLPVAVSRGGLRAEGVVLAGGLFLASTPYVRNLPLGALGLAPALAAGLAGLAALGRERLGSARWARLRRVALAAAALAALLLARATLSDQFHANDDHDVRAGVRLDPTPTYPEAAAHLDAAPPEGLLWNQFGSGHYLSWARGQARPKPFISGNVDLYPRSHYRRYRETLALDAPAFGRALDALGITCALVDHRRAPAALVAGLHSDPGWTLTHADPHAVVFRRGGGAPLDVDALVRAARGWTFPDEVDRELPPVALLRRLGLLSPRPVRPLERVHFALLLDALGRPRAALVQARRARELDAASPPVLAALADLERRAGDWARARARAEELVALRPGVAEPRVALARALRVGPQPDLRRAVAELRAALALAPGSPVAQRELLETCRRAGDAVALRRALAAALAGPRPPGEAERLFYAGAAARLEGEVALAADVLARAVAADPDVEAATTLLALQLLGEATSTLGRLEEAQAAFERLTEVRPGDPKAWRNVGVVRAARGRTEAALAAWDQAAAVDDDETLSLIYGADALRERAAPGDAARAHALLDAAAARDPEDDRIERVRRGLPEEED